MNAITYPATEELLRSWHVNQHTFEILKKEPEIVEWVAKAKARYPLPPGYNPRIVEFLSNELILIRLVDGQLQRLVGVSENYKIPFLEIRFDERECAYFQVDKEILVNRLELMRELDKKIGLNQANVPQKLLEQMPKL